MSQKTSITCWHKIGIAAGILGFAVGNLMFYGGRLFAEGIFEMLKPLLILMFLGCFAVGIYCWAKTSLGAGVRIFEKF